MKKIILTLLFVLLALLALYYTFYRHNTTLNRSENQFAVKNIKEIDNITISDKKNNINLVKVNDRWTVENKKVRKDLINTLLGVSEGLDAISPVSHEQKDSVKIWIEDGTQVIFSRKGRMVSSFRICKHDNSIYGIQNNSATPYKLSLRGFPDVDLTKIYASKAEYWMTNTLLDLEAADIKSVHVEYTANTENNFHIEKATDKQYYLGKNKPSNNNQDFDNKTVTEYLSFFKDIRYYPFTDTATVKKEIIDKQKPFFHLSLTTLNDSITEIWGYHKPKPEGDDSDPYEFYGVTKEKGIMLLKYNDFDPILVNLDYFLKK